MWARLAFSTAGNGQLQQGAQIYQGRIHPRIVRSSNTMQTIRGPQITRLDHLSIYACHSPPTSLCICFCIYLSGIILYTRRNLLSWPTNVCSSNHVLCATREFWCIVFGLLEKEKEVITIHRILALMFGNERPLQKQSEANKKNHSEHNNPLLLAYFSGLLFR